MAKTDVVMKNLIVLEGIGGVGKSTALSSFRKIAEKEFQGRKFAYLKFPSEQPLGKLARERLQQQVGCPRTWAPLLLQDMVEVTSSILADTETIYICDRYFFTTLVYQSALYPKGDLYRMVKLFQVPIPGQTILFTADPKSIQSRVQGRGDVGDRFDLLPEETINKWQDEYKRIPQLWFEHLGELYGPKWNQFYNVSPEMGLEHLKTAVRWLHK